LGKRRHRHWLVVATLAFAAACHGQAPEGQVLAVVNGEEITIPELNAEAHARGLAIGNDVAARRALLQELIDRRLLAQTARKQGLDRTPDYILQSRRADELVLVQQLNEVMSHSSGQPTPQQLSAFIAANPQAFGQRAVVTVEQMSLPGPIPPANAAAVAVAPGLEQAAAVLGNPALANSKAMQTWDTARLDPQSANELLQAPADRLLVLHPPGSGWLVARKISATPSPVLPAQQQATALALIKAQSLEQAAATLLAQARSRAKVVIAKEADEQRR
jgi:peptidyl-prolyl cis-trans isomerase C